MHTNAQLITTFYAAFQQKDFITMQSCYSDKATFNDEAFKDLNAEEVRAMWEMLLTRGKDLALTFSDVTADNQKGSATWIATYTFSRTGRKVTNHIQANFEFQEGKISKHVDHFDLYSWSKQAMGWPGLLLGWTGSFKRKIQEGAKASLHAYMKTR